MKKNKQGSRTRVTVKNTTERRESRRHDQKETLFFDIKSLFTPRRGKKIKNEPLYATDKYYCCRTFSGVNWLCGEIYLKG